MIFLACIGSSISLIGAGLYALYGYSLKLASYAAKKGYRFTQDDMKKYSYEALQSRKAAREKTGFGASTIHMLKVVGKLVVVLTPGVNLAAAIISSKKHCDSVYRSMEKDGVLIPLSKSERDELNESSNAFEKFWASVGFIADADQTKFNLDFPPLEDLGYSLEEVEKLDEIMYGRVLRLGAANDQNIAIIGLPDSTVSVTEVVFPDQENEVHEFKELSRDEAKDKTFVVYPYYFNQEMKENLDAAVAAMKEARMMDSSVSTDSRSLPDTISDTVSIPDTVLESYVTSPFVEDSKSSKGNEGPRLVKRRLSSSV